MGAAVVRVTRSLISASFHCSRSSCHTPRPSISRTAGMVKTVGQKVGRIERFMASPKKLNHRGTETQRRKVFDTHLTTAEAVSRSLCLCVSAVFLSYGSPLVAGLAGA